MCAHKKGTLGSRPPPFRACFNYTIFWGVGGGGGGVYTKISSGRRSYKGRKKSKHGIISERNTGRVSVRVQGVFNLVLVGNPAFGAGKVDGVSRESWTGWVIGG